MYQGMMERRCDVVMSCEEELAANWCEERNGGEQGR